MTHEKPGLEERLSAAFNSRDLRSEPTKRKDADYLGALGLAQRGHHGSTLRLHLSGSQADYRAAREAAQRMAVNIGFARRWNLSVKNMRRAGELALAHHVFPVCPHCKGVRYEVPEGAPYPTAKKCQPCDGSGLRPVQDRFHHEINELMVALETIDTLTARAVGRHLG